MSRVLRVLSKKDNKDTGEDSPLDPIAFIAKHGVVLASAKGPVPSLAQAIAGEPIIGSWWSHRRAHAIFRALAVVDDCPDVLCFRLVDRKLTFVHRRLWPALVRLAGAVELSTLAAVRQQHTATGAHRNVVTPFPDWVPAGVQRAAAALSESAAREALGCLASTQAQHARCRA